MKKIIILLTVVCLMTELIAQNGFTYQSIVRNSEYDINSLICETETIQIENPLISDSFC